MPTNAPIIIDAILVASEALNLLINPVFIVTPAIIKINVNNEVIKLWNIQHLSEDN